MDIKCCEKFFQLKLVIVLVPRIVLYLAKLKTRIIAFENMGCPQLTMVLPFCC